MTIMGASRDRCRLCFSLIGRDRSICCQKSFHLFKPIERQKLPLNKSTSYSIEIRKRTVCLHDLLRRYLRTSINPNGSSSNLICGDCSMILLDVEQCAKYLRKTINQLKIKLNRSTRLQTSSLSATFQKKIRAEQHLSISQETLANSDSDDQFDDQFDDENDEESNGQQNSRKIIQDPRKSEDQRNSECNDPDEEDNDVDDDDDDDDNDDENDENDNDEDGLIKSSSSVNFDSSSEITNTNNNTTNLNGFPTKTAENNVNLFQQRLSHMISSQSSPQQIHVDSTMNTLAQMQRTLLFQFLNDPLAAAQAAQAAAAAAAAMSASPIKAALASMPLLTSNLNTPLNSNKQMGSGRKRKSTPEKRVINNHRTSTNAVEASPTNEHEPSETNNTPKDPEELDYPLELTFKNNAVRENGVSFFHHRSSTPNEDRHETGTNNDLSLSLSPSLIRRSTSTKRVKTPNSSAQFDPSKLVSSQTTDLLSPNHQMNLHDDLNSNSQSKQPRKLDPRSCKECGKILFNDKAHLLHRQTHAPNEKQCWICGAHDNDMKKHISSEHANQKFTDDGFKCQHCEKSFFNFADLEAHTREHTKKKPFECSICHKRFGQQGNLSCHLRIHSGVKPFTCANCGKAFRHSNSLRRHARTVHSASRGLTMSPGSMATSTTGSSLLLSTVGTSNSMVTMANDIHHLSTSDAYDDGPSTGLLIASDEGESLQGLGSPSTGDAQSPDMSNAHMDSDSPEPM